VEVIDTRALEQLQELIGGDRDELVELVQTFLVEGDDIVADMSSALEVTDADLLRRSAHSLKASAQDFGAPKLSTLSATLESACKSGIPDGAVEQVSEIANQYAAVRDELQTYIAS
jgi:HPt (histidine-containing phosphotransfer) domain-containing protein